MSFTKTFLLECSRENGENVKITQRQTGSENASWVNKVNFNFKVGDQVSLESAVIHSIGASADSTIEITGENDDITGNADNFLGMKFANYVADNGYNTIHLPLHSPTTTNQNFGLVPTAQSQNANQYNGWDFPGQSMAIIQQLDDNNNMKVNVGMPVFTDNAFKFRYSVDDGFENRVDGHLGNNPKYCRTLWGAYPHENNPNCQFSITNRKYTKLRSNYCGPYRRTDTTFWDDDDLTELWSSFAMEINAPIYESPSTICNNINTQLHSTVPMGEAPSGGVVPMAHDKIIPHVSGNLMKVITANGVNEDTFPDDDSDKKAVNRCWGNIAVESFEKWEAIHQMMKCDLAFDMKGKFRLSLTEYTFPRPCIYLDALSMKQNFRSTYNGTLNEQHIKGWLPRVQRQFTWKHTKDDSSDVSDAVSTSIPYACLPKYFVISTNIKYTKDNIKRIRKWFENMERYVGDETDLDKCKADTENWEVVADLGCSKDGMNSRDAPLDGGEEYGTGSNTATKVYAPFTGVSRRLRNGAFDVRQDNSGNHYPYSTVYGFAESVQEAYDLASKNNEDETHVKGVATPRIDIPKTEYFTQYTGNVPTEAELSERFYIHEITKDVPCRFKDNKYKNCGMVLFSKQIPFEKWKFSNLSANQDINENHQEGFGEWLRNGDFQPVDVDTSLSGDLGVYGMDIVNDDSPLSQNFEKCCVFILAHDSATYNNTNQEWVPNNPYALPNIYHGLFFGLSPSFMDSPAIWMINQERNDDNANQASGEAQIQNYMNIGANDATCQFDDSLSRAKFFNFHTQRLLGAREMPIADNTISKETLGNFVIKVNDKTYYYQDAFNWTETLDNANPENNTVNILEARGALGLSTTICGLNLIELYTNIKGGKSNSIDNMIIINNEEDFFNSLLYKLGFDYKQFFPDFGIETNWYDPSIQGDYSSENRYRITKPISTNAELDISQVLALAVQDSTTVPIYGTAAKDVQTYQLGFNSGESTSLDGTNSTAIIANNLPTKMDHSFYRIHSNIIPTQYKAENENINIIGVCPKNYVEGDFIYSPNPSSYSIMAEFPLKIGEITTEIRLPNGRLAPIDQKSTVTYKVQREMPAPDMNEILQDIKKNNLKK